MTTMDERIATVNEAIARRDLDAVSSLLHPDMVWEHNIGQGTPEEGVYEGRESVVGLLSRIIEPWEYIRAEPSEIKVLGADHLLVRGELHAKHVTTETEIVTPYEQSLEFEEGLLRKGRMSVGAAST